MLGVSITRTNGAYFSVELVVVISLCAPSCVCRLGDLQMTLRPHQTNAYDDPTHLTTKTVKIVDMSSPCEIHKSSTLLSSADGRLLVHICPPPPESLFFLLFLRKCSVKDGPVMDQSIWTQTFSMDAARISTISFAPQDGHPRISCANRPLDKRRGILVQWYSY